MKKEYAMYKGDELLAFGTIKEISKQLNIKLCTLYYYNSPTYKKLQSKYPNRIELIRIEDDDDEENEENIK